MQGPNVQNQQKNARHKVNMMDRIKNKQNKIIKKKAKHKISMMLKIK